MNMKLKFFSLSLSVILIIIADPLRAEINNKMRSEIRKEIEIYIKNNPGIIRDALVSLAEREEQDQRKKGLAKVQVTEGDPIMGNPDGKLTIYTFSDYNCGYCKRMLKTLQTLIAKNADLRLVIKEFPILNQLSVTAAKAGIAAQRQNKFESFHIGMMNYRGQVTQQSIMNVAKEANIDLDQLRQDMNAFSTTKIIDRTRDAALALGINGTPGFVIGNTILPGLVDIKRLQALIENERKKKG